MLLWRSSWFGLLVGSLGQLASWQQRLRSISRTSMASTSPSGEGGDVVGGGGGGSDGGPKKWSRASEEKLRRQFLHEARDKCKVELSAFAKCCKDEGMMLVLRCRDAKNVANECVKQYSSDETYAAYKKEKKDAWIKQGVLLPD